MNVLLTVLGGAAWVLSRLGLALLVLLAVVLALALLALLIPFCADVAWEGEEGQPRRPGPAAGAGRGAGASPSRCSSTPKPVPPRPPRKGRSLQGPACSAGCWPGLKAKLAARREARRQKNGPPKPPPAGPKRPPNRGEKAKFTLDTLRALLQAGGKMTRAVFGGAARDPHPAVLAGERGRAGRGRPGLRPGQRMALPHAGGAEPLYLPGL